MRARGMVKTSVQIDGRAASLEHPLCCFHRRAAAKSYGAQELIDRNL